MKLLFTFSSFAQALLGAGGGHGATWGVACIFHGINLWR